MKIRDALLVALPTAALTGGLTAYAGDGDPGDPPIEYSYDTGSHTARVFAFCIGADAMYLLGDTDEFKIEADDTNCQAGGFLRDPDNDRELEDH